MCLHGHVYWYISFIKYLDLPTLNFPLHSSKSCLLQPDESSEMRNREGRSLSMGWESVSPRDQKYWQLWKRSSWASLYPWCPFLLPAFPIPGTALCWELPDTLSSNQNDSSIAVHLCGTYNSITDDRHYAFAHTAFWKEQTLKIHCKRTQVVQLKSICWTWL